MTTATEIARRAVKVAGTLSSSMDAEMREATVRDGALRIPGRHRTSTEGALARRGLIEPGTTVVTDFGRLVRVVLMKGADEVLARAARADKAAAAATEGNAQVAEAGRAAAARAIEFGSSERWMGEALDEITDRSDARAVAYRAALLNELHTRALVENATRDGDAEWITLGVVETSEAEREQARAEMAGEHRAVEFIAEGHSEREMGEALDVAHAVRSMPMVRAFREIVLAELHTRAQAGSNERTAAPAIHDTVHGRVHGTDDMREIARRVREAPPTAGPIDRVDDMRDIVGSIRDRQAASAESAPAGDDFTNWGTEQIRAELADVQHRLENKRRTGLTQTQIATLSLRRTRLEQVLMERAGAESTVNRDDDAAALADAATPQPESPTDVAEVTE